jgi:hypothetical protein
MCAKGANPPAQVVNISSLYNCRRPWSGFFTYRFWTTQRMCFSDNRCRPFYFLALFQVFIIFPIIFFIFLRENLGNSWIFFLIIGWNFDFFFCGGAKTCHLFYMKKLKRKTLTTAVREFTRVWARPVSQPLGSGFSTLFQIQEPWGPIQKAKAGSMCTLLLISFGSRDFYFYFLILAQMKRIHC